MLVVEWGRGSDGKGVLASIAVVVEVVSKIVKSLIVLLKRRIRVVLSCSYACS